MKVVTIISGGMDSATLAYSINESYNGEPKVEQHFLSFDYGQRHARELTCAKLIATKIGGEHHIINLSSVGPLLKGSALTDTKNVNMPQGYYAEENMRLTVVPNRNAIMLSIAWGVAQGEEANLVYYGAHAGDHFIYPDCRREFVNALSEAFYVGSQRARPSKIVAPFLDCDKSEILRRGLKLHVPYELTWTCYVGGEKACGKCGSCTERLHAFYQNGVEDPIEYSDRDYWKTVVPNYASSERSK